MFQRGVLLLVAIASGVAAIVYQIVWQRLLTLITGTDTASVTIIVAATMAGLGLGSLAGGSIADRLSPRRRLEVIAGSELAIALFAVISVPFFYDVLYARYGAREWPAAAAAVLHAGATLWPTFFMGLTFPLISRALTTDPSAPARWVPRLYGWNTIGAAIGGGTTTLWLLPAMGLPAIVFTAAAVSTACAIAVFAIARSHDPRAIAIDGQSDRRTATGPSIATWMALFAASGFIALALEIVWFQILGVILKADASTFGRLLAFYLGGLGLGALAGQSPIPRRWPAARSFFLLQAAIPIYSGVAIAAFSFAVINVPLLTPLALHLAGAAGLTAATPLDPTSIAIGWLTPIALMSVPTFLMGLSFGSLQREVQISVATVGRRAGWLQAANIAGSVAGALLTGFVLIDRIGPSGTLRLLMTAGGVFLWLGIRELPPPRRRPTTALATAVVIVALLLLPDRLALWGSLHGQRRGEAIVASDSSGVAVIKQLAEVSVLLVNGRGQSTLPYGGLQADLGIVPTMLHPNPARVAIIGLGTGTTTFAAGGRTETTQIDTIEVVEPVMTALREYDASRHYPALAQLFRDPRMHFEFADGRAFLARARQKYDVIEADARRPDSAYSSYLYSVEYFSLLRRQLNSGGYAVTWLPTPRVRESLRAAFPHGVIWGELGIGSDRPVLVDEALIRQRLARPQTAAYFRNAGFDPVELMSGYFAESPERFTPGDPRPARAQTIEDRFPRDEFGVLRD